MSKLKALIAIPIALLGVKRLQETIKDNPNPQPFFKKVVDDTQVRPRDRFGL